MYEYNITVKSHNVFLSVDIQRVRRCMLKKRAIIDFFEQDYTEVAFAVKCPTHGAEMINCLKEELEQEYEYLLSVYNVMGAEEVSL